MTRSAIADLVNPPNISLYDIPPTKKEGWTTIISKAQRERNGHLLDAVKEKLGLQTDYQLARVLAVDNAVICKVRSGTNGLSASMAIRIHERADMTFKEMRRVLGLAEAASIATSNRDRSLIPEWKEVSDGKATETAPGRPGDGGTPGNGRPIDPTE